MQLDLFGNPSPAPRRRGEVAAVNPPETLRQLAQRLPPGLRLGTSSWSFPGWDGLVYDGAYSAQQLAQRGLAAYARHPLLRAVGIDRAYYGPLSAAQYRAYAADTPADFRFLVKAHELCTAPRVPSRGAGDGAAGGLNPLFLDADYAAREVVQQVVAGLAERLGVLLLQFPPLRLRDVGGAGGFLERLQRFLRALPQGVPYAVELRNQDLFSADHVEVLSALRVSHCYNVHPSMPSIAQQAQLCPPAQQPALIVRWMLHSGLQYDEAVERYQPFDRIVDDDPRARGDIAALLSAELRQRPAMVIANNKAEGSAPLTLRRLAESVADRAADG